MTAVQEITVREAARRVHRSTETIRRWIWSGRLPATKRGNTYYVDVNYLDRVAVGVNAGDWHAAPDAPGLGSWLAEVGQWRSGLGGAGRGGGQATASDLVTGDRYARR
jgi:excisionase family DNA binding protein